MKPKFNRPWQAAWDKRHMKIFSTKLTASQAARVRSACDRAGITPYKLIQDFLLNWVSQEEKPRRIADEYQIRW